MDKASIAGDGRLVGYLGRHGQSLSAGRLALPRQLVQDVSQCPASTTRAPGLSRSTRR
jgi:hypothetical protein